MGTLLEVPAVCKLYVMYSYILRPAKTSVSLSLYKTYMQLLLTHLADVFTGLTIRNRNEITMDGRVRLIQPRSVVGGPRLDLANIDYIDERPQSDRQYLTGGELILRTRGSRFEAALFPADGIATMAAAPLIVLRPDAKRVVPEYLQWLLNESPEVRQLMERVTRGSTVQALNIEDLAKMTVPRPSLSRQRAIVEASTLSRRATELERQLSQLRKTYTALALSAAASKE